MKLVIQRVTNASVEVEGEITGQIEEGLMVLVGFGQTDTKKKLNTWQENYANSEYSLMMKVE